MRVIDPEGNQIGILSRDEALQKAQELGLDLVEIAANANPPVVKIVDFQKYKYQERKKEQAAKRNAREIELKEVWLSPRIAGHDLEVRMRQAEGFLDKGNKVKVTVKFRGREMAHPETGHRILDQALQFFGSKIKVEREARFEGRSLSVIIGKL